MRLSTKGRYGLRAVLEIAARHGEGPVTTQTIAQNQGISERYLDQIMIPLKRSGIINSVRGARGGYVLAKKAEAIKVGDIIRALEGPIAPADCVSEQSPLQCRRQEMCITRPLWAKLRDSITEVLDSYTLAELAEEAAAMKKEDTGHYNI